MKFIKIIGWRDGLSRSALEASWVAKPLLKLAWLVVQDLPLDPHPAVAIPAASATAQAGLRFITGASYRTGSSTAGFPRPLRVYRWRHEQ
jgi:hypothetical protein